MGSEDNNEKTFTVEKDGALVIKGEDGSPVRYVKETDLLTVKGSRMSKEDVAKEVESAKAAAVAEATTKLEAEHQKALQAEARLSSLEEQLRQASGNSAETARIKQELEAARLAEKSSATKLLELKRELIIGRYNVPKATVESKDLKELELFEEALRAVVGDKNIGNFAIGGGGGGANALQGKSPIELAQLAYSTSNKK